VVNNIIYVPDLGRNTPASINRRTGDIYINLKRWRNIAPEHRFFILLHELGHYVLQSTDEKAVDDWAFQQYVKAGGSLKQAVFALTDVLSGRSWEHVERIEHQLQRAIQQDNSEKMNVDNALDISDFEYNPRNLKGMSFKEKRKAKREIKMTKKLGKANKKHAKANNIQAEADARGVLAEQGIAMDTRAGAIGKAFAGLAGGAINAMTGGALSAGGMTEELVSDSTNYNPQNGTYLENNARTVEPQYTTPQSNQRAVQTQRNITTTTTTGKPKDNKKMYMIVGGLVLLVLVFFITQKK
jgi:hypothetical protein